MKSCLFPQAGESGDNVFSIAAVSSETGIKMKETLAEREIFVGRSKKCHLVLRDETVSGLHCRLVAIEGGAIVMDEGSTNGTFLNGELVVRPTIMDVNDELRVGPYRLRVQSLVGNANAPLVARPSARSRRMDPPVPAEALPQAERPPVFEKPTDLQITQAQVFWRILGFQEPGTLEQARAAYEALTRDCQPDSASELNPQLRALAEQRLRELGFAWEYIQRLCRRSRDAA
jgi:pSer/pThr/pTyr-binding forkhead associated (FHA) protein